jgi:hypothetical protein
VLVNVFMFTYVVPERKEGVFLLRWLETGMLLDLVTDLCIHACAHMHIYVIVRMESCVHLRRNTHICAHLYTHRPSRCMLYMHA